MLTFDGAAIVKAVVSIRNVETIAKNFDEKRKKRERPKT
jgi:hypothetical protein